MPYPFLNELVGKRTFAAKDKSKECSNEERQPHIRTKTQLGMDSIAESLADSAKFWDLICAYLRKSAADVFFLQDIE
jgi:hypothetical protein